MKLNQQMSDSERELIKIIWDNGGSIFIAELLEKVEENNKGWKRSTVLTFLTRLTEKGFIKTEKYKRKNKYIATLSESEYMEEQTTVFLHKVYDGNAKKLVSTLLKQDRITSKDFEELEKFWNKDGV
ncbi:BlaI/MecI/CopY family transcriptional regulator [Tissierella carlieri]|jgi:BlaI family penicillinase repressor|uniref:BlaI/MecI/CopY family transcriptional regulator n=1 Tax=Tissierella carlieri TaxID=689904 RepID=A0ABT1SGI1_9FIRM|nr:BlaI/MecI/CopY family transcriptional regulator [Tissierella carlieri]MCQ4925599.1 BlaI/MecI/CopY family transcriptional regulator [Tissierella carlieri]